MDKIARLRQEIERRLNILTNVYAEQVERKDEEMMNYYHGKVIALEELRPFLDTLSEEPDKSLEEAADEHYDEMWDELGGFAETRDGCYDIFFPSKAIRDTFIAGAEWQASQMPMPEDTVLFNKGVAEGRRLGREDMLKDAVEATVMDFSSNQPKPQIDVRLDPHKYHTGDKVRIVVLKEEEE